MRKSLVLSLAFVALMCALVPFEAFGAVVTEGAATKGWFPNFPFEKNPRYYFTVRLWELGHNPLWDETAPVELHELSPAEFAYLDEDPFQHVSVLQYDPPNPTGDTVWGLYHEELNFVLWTRRIPDQKGTLGQLAQVGETAKDVYNPALTPAENDAAGNIDWFVVDNTWYPRTLSKRVSWPGQSWSELWGPFDGVFLQRDYTVSFVQVVFKGKQYLGVQVSIVGPSEGDPNVIATEKQTFINNIGWYQRYFDLTTTSGIMLFKHIATLQDVSFP